MHIADCQSIPFADTVDCVCDIPWCILEPPAYVMQVGKEKAGNYLVVSDIFRLIVFLFNKFIMHLFEQ